MPRIKYTTLKITPQTHVRSTQNDAIFFRINEADLLPDGIKRKKRLVRYNEYKKEVYRVAKAANFELPNSRAHIIFHIPVSRSWSAKKKADYHGQPHLHKPDWDNLAKAFQEPLLKQDSTVWNCEVSKFWINSDQGKIDIQIKGTK